MSQIIVAVDFSKKSLNAANYAADMAVSLRKDITLTHVMEIPVTPFQVPITELEFSEIETAIKEELEDLRQKLLLRTKNKININKELRYGLIDQELEKMSEETKPFAIVMGVAGGEKKLRFFLGSNTLRMIPDALYPLLIIPENAVFNQIKKITIASDLSEKYSSNSFDFIKKWLRIFTAHCDIVYVHSEQKMPAEFIPETTTLREKFAEFNPEFHFINSANTDTGILDFIEEKKPDLLVVLPEKHGRLAFLFHTSISRKLVLHAHLPILCVAAHNMAIDLISDQSEYKQHDCLVCNGACKKESISISKKVIDESH